MIGTTQIRAYEVARDRRAVLDLLAQSLGPADRELRAALFDWKHEQNPAGASPAWVAVDGGEVVAFRAFLRWEFERDGELVRAVRAVDTATRPDHRGRGLFAELTRHGLEHLAADGVAFVFNTPNDASRPGYLKMGWEPVGHLPVGVRVASPGALVRLARSRTAAALGSEVVDVARPAAAALAEADHLRPPVDGGLQTRRSPAYLQWRYGLDRLCYRALGDEQGVVVFRVRRRGPAVEAVVVDTLVADGSARRAARWERELPRRAGAHHALKLHRGGRDHFVRLPGQGPLLVWRPLVDERRPSLREWYLTMGDIELF